MDLALLGFTRRISFTGVTGTPRWAGCTEYCTRHVVIHRRKEIMQTHTQNIHFIPQHSLCREVLNDEI